MIETLLRAVLPGEEGPASVIRTRSEPEDGPDGDACTSLIQAVFRVPPPHEKAEVMNRAMITERKRR